MSQLVLHPTTSQNIEHFLYRPSHALLLVAPTGAGKRSLASHLAEKLLELEAGQLKNYPYARTISPTGTSIGIEQVRELEHFLKLKVPNMRTIQRVVILEDGHRLTDEAQNALLKTLEEPPADTVLIITANSLDSLLPTVRSRAQHINVYPPAKEAILDHFTTLASDEEISRAYALSGGLPGLLHAILTDEAHPLSEATKVARSLLTQSTFERLAAVDQLAKQKELALDVMFTLQQMAQLSLRTAEGAQAQKWSRVLQVSYEAEQGMRLSAQPKLLLTYVMLNL